MDGDKLKCTDNEVSIIKWIIYKVYFRGFSSSRIYTLYFTIKILYHDMAMPTQGFLRMLNLGLKLLFNCLKNFQQLGPTGPSWS